MIIKRKNVFSIVETARGLFLNVMIIIIKMEMDVVEIAVYKLVSFVKVALLIPKIHAFSISLKK